MALLSWELLIESFGRTKISFGQSGRIHTGSQLPSLRSETNLQQNGRIEVCGFARQTWNSLMTVTIQNCCRLCLLQDHQRCANEQYTDVFGAQVSSGQLPSYKLLESPELFVNPIWNCMTTLSGNSPQVLLPEYRTTVERPCTYHSQMSDIIQTCVQACVTEHGVQIMRRSYTTFRTSILRTWYRWRRRSPSPRASRTTTFFRTMDR
jgi:hypothetical protein